MSDDILKVLRPGSGCMLGDVHATIISVQIEVLCKVSYNVSWIVNGDRKTAWVEGFELDVKSMPVRDPLEVGFE